MNESVGYMDEQLRNQSAVEEQQKLETEYLPSWTDFVLAALFSLLIVITIVGNTLVIASVITTRRLRSVTNCFVSSLAAADLLVGLAVMPPAVLLQLNGGFWKMGQVLCISWVSLDVLLCTASILSLCAISVDRYLAVTQPLVYSRRRRSKKLAALMIIVVWLLAGAITSPPLLGCFPQTTKRDNTKCSYNMDSSYVVFSAMGSFFLPMLVMLYVYARISCVIARRHRNLEATEGEDFRRGHSFLSERKKSIMRKKKTDVIATAERNIESCDDKTSNESQMPGSCRKFDTVRTHHHSCINRVARETKTAGTLAVVVGGFVACWLPFFILYLITPFLPMEPPEVLMKALIWLGWINSAINPFIYAFYSADFRLAFWRLTCRKCCKIRTTSLDRVERAIPPSANWKKETSKT